MIKLNSHSTYSFTRRSLALTNGLYYCERKTGYPKSDLLQRPRTVNMAAKAGTRESRPGYNHNISCWYCGRTARPREQGKEDGSNGFVIIILFIVIIIISVNFTYVHEFTPGLLNVYDVIHSLNTLTYRIVMNKSVSITIILLHTSLRYYRGRVAIKSRVGIENIGRIFAIRGTWGVGRCHPNQYDLSVVVKGRGRKF